MAADSSRGEAWLRNTRAILWAQPRLFPHVRIFDAISALGTYLFLGTLFGGALLDELSGGLSRQGDRAVQATLAGAVALFLLGAALRWLAVLPATPEAPSRRLAEIRESLTLLEQTLSNLVVEVDVMSQNADGLEQRLNETQRLIGLTEQERSAIFRELGRRDRASMRQNVVLFAAGIAAGVLTNLFIS